MRIDDLTLTATIASQSGKAEESQRVSGDDSAGRPGGKPGTTGDRVQLSSLANHLANSLDEVSQARAVRVDRLAGLYRAGGYRFDSAQVSRALLAETLSESAGAGPSAKSQA